MSEAPLLEIRDLHAGYEGVEVLHSVDLTIDAGSVTAVLGANGAGKSTLMAVAAGIHDPTSGDVAFCGESITGSSAARLARRGLCLVPEGRGVFPNLTVRENLWMMTYCGTRRHDVEDRAYSHFPRLSERRSQHAGSLSGGEQQMLAMARAVVSDPKLLLLDELSMGLAPMVVEELYGLVGELARTGVTVVVVEQFARIALSVATTGVVMSGGRIVHAGAPAEIESALHSAYLGTANSAG
ncbi:MAG TPA: ABC transporter ATP-binding protein [Acidimicrobiales bacterium]|nr:ABC transporter ATP-binding protein [Acidimicrobiales bacterium]